MNWESYSSIPPLSGIIGGVITQLQPTKNKQKNSAIPKTNNFFIVTFIVLEFIKYFWLLALNISVAEKRSLLCF